MVQNERIPKHPNIRREARKHEKQGITLLAAQLANDETIQDYWLITNPASIDYFGHVVAVIVDENQNKYALLVHTKLQTTKTMRLITDPNTKPDSEKCDIPLHKYLQSYNKIMNLDVDDGLKEILQDVPRENFYFGLFTNTSRNVMVQTKTKQFVNLTLNSKTVDENILNCFGSYAQYPEPAETLPQGYERFLKQFYIFAEQPDTESIYKELQEYIGKSANSTADGLCDAIEDAIREDGYCMPLTKLLFFEKCLETELAHIILE